MAGIGFELRKILKSELIINRIKGFAYATVVSVGPMIISVLMILAIGQYMKQIQVPIMERDLINTTIMYSYVFAMISVSGLNMIMSRYLADQIYLNKKERILSSLSGSITVLVTVSGLICFGFYAFSMTPLAYKFLAYLLFMELCCLYLFMVYLSAVKDYKKITWSFSIGAMLTIVLIVLLQALKIPITLTILIGLDAGLMVNMIFMLFIIKKHFGKMSIHMFQFLHYIIKMPRLVLTSIFYALGLFAHNIIFWLLSDLSINLQKTFFYAPIYDNATFFAVVTIIPSSIFFVVRVETSFYEKYRDFCQAIVSGGSLKAIDLTKESMIATLKKELSTLFEIQFLTTIILIILGVYIILPALGADSLTIGIYSILAISYFLIQMLFFTVTMLLYFDNQEDSLKVTGLFLVLSILLTLLSLLLGHSYYGLGLCLSALISLVFSIRCLLRMLKKVDYRLLSKPPYMSEAEVAGTQKSKDKAASQ
jgi:polysaccharide biosynthesis protein PelG